MQILVDGRPYRVPAETGSQTLQQLAETVCSPSTDERGRLVVGLACDGSAVQPDRLEELLARQVSSFESVELQTVALSEQVSVTLGQAIEVLGGADELREQVADDLTQGLQEAAMEGLGRLLETFKQVQQTTFLTSQLLSIPLETVRVGEQDLAAVLAGIKDRLNELKEGMESQDFVLVADILRYQFSEPLDSWMGILHALRDAAEAE